MAREFAKRFYASTAWRKCRAAYFQKQHGLCERCRGLGKIVHHKTYITPDNITDTNITLNMDNLELLCQDCHNTEHHERYGVTVEGVGFDDEGNLVQL